MKEQIRKIVEDFISEGDYKKALSLMTSLPLDDEQDKALFDSCKNEFVNSCVSAITEAVKTKDKEKAEQVLSAYKQLLGEDANTALYQTIVDGIQKQKEPQPTTEEPEAEPKEEPEAEPKEEPEAESTEEAEAEPTEEPEADQTEEAEAENTIKEPFATLISKMLKNPAEIVKDCAVDDKCGTNPLFEKSFRIISCLWLMIIVFIFNQRFYRVSDGLFIMLASTSAAIALSLIVSVCFSKNILFKVVAIPILTIPAIIYLLGGKPVVLWLTSIVYSVVYFFVTPGEDKVTKGFVACMLFTILNPLMYYLALYELDDTGILTSIIIIACYAITIRIFYDSFSGGDGILKRLSSVLNTVKTFVVEHKKLSIISVSSISVLIIIIAVIANIQKQREEEEQREAYRVAAIEQARQDSIQAIENERIRAEEARKAAIEKARQDSIREVQRREQARRDSIAEIEHAAFVKKYARIGVIVEYMTMTRGTEDGEGTKGIKFRVFNPTKKTIKYVIISAYPVDRFGSRLYYTETCRGIGPVNSYDYGSWDFDDVFEDRNDVIDDIKVSMQVVYTDGSSKSINVRNATVSYNDYEYSWFRD